MMHDRHLEAVAGLCSDAQMYPAVLNQHVAVGVIARIALREALDYADQRHAEERQIRVARRALRESRVEVFAQPLQLGDVHFLDVREVRDIALGLGHALRADAADAENADLLGLGARLALRAAVACDAARSSLLRLVDRGVQVLPLNAAIAAAADDGREI